MTPFFILYNNHGKESWWHRDLYPSWVPVLHEDQRGLQDAWMGVY